MALVQFVFGTAGSGKSTYVYNRVISQSKKEKNRHFLVIVPEQFTMQTQRSLVFLHPEKSIMNIDVLSFERLAYRVFDELGTSTCDVLGETGKSLVLRRIASEKADELKYLKSNLKRNGYIQQLKSLISELEQYNITPDDLKKMSADKNMPQTFKSKADDVRIIYEEYLGFLQDRYVTKEKILELLIEVVADSELVKDSCIVFDGFTGFTPIENHLIRNLMPLAKDMIFTGTLGEEVQDIFSEPEEEELFAMTKKMAVSVLKMTEETGSRMLDPVRLSGANGRFIPDGRISHLEKNIFRQKKDRKFHPVNKDYADAEEKQDSISIYHLADKRSELEFVVEQIRKRVIEGGMRYHDIAVVCPDIEQYRYIVKSVFDRAKVPVFIDEKQTVDFNPCIEFTEGALETVTNNFSYESVIRFLRSGLTGLKDSDIDLIDNYLFASGIRGKSKYRSEFTRIPAGYNEEEVRGIYELIQPIAEKLLAFSDAFTSDSTVSDLCRALYELLSSFKIEDQMMDLTEVLEDSDPAASRSYAEIYPYIIDLLDQMYNLIPSEKVTADEFSDLIISGMTDASAGMIPSTTDSVVFGDIERTRLFDVKVLFLIGATDASIPKQNNPAGIFNDRERLILKEDKFELSATARERAFMQKFYLYLVLTKASEEIVITYASDNGDDSAAGPSYLIRTIKNLYNDLEETEISRDDFDEFLYSGSAVSDVTDRLLRQTAAQEISDKNRRLLAGLLPINPSKEKVDTAFFTYTPDKISEIVQSASEDGVSVSRLEQFARCAYSYFLKYDLYLKERQEYGLKNTDLGTLYHDVLDKYSMRLKNEDISWADVSDEKRESFLNDSIGEAMGSLNQADIFDSERERYQLESIRRTLSRTVAVLTDQIRMGSFEPGLFEISLDKISDARDLTLELSGDEKITLKGQIDRLDTKKTDDGMEYIKIIDYKSSAHDLSLSELYNGIQIQLIYYMDAAVKGLTARYRNLKILPGAAFYYQIKDPVITASVTESDEKIREELMKSCMVSGLIRNDENVITAIDREFEGLNNDLKSYSSLAAKLGTKADCTLKQSGSLISGDDFNVLGQFVEKKTKELAEGIISLDLNIYPYRMENASACSYCPFKPVCGFDPRLPGFKYYNIFKKDNQIVLQDIRKELTDEEVTSDE